MYVAFDKLPETARIWVYQANRSLIESELSTISQVLQSDLSQWAAHGQPLLASVQIIANRFVVIGVDEGFNLPSGCSIDASARTMQVIGRQLDVDFFDRSVAVQSADGTVQTIALADLKAAVANGVLQPDTLLLNTLVKTKVDWQTNWQIRAADSWVKRYFKQIPAIN